MTTTSSSDSSAASTRHTLASHTEGLLELTRPVSTSTLALLARSMPSLIPPRHTALSLKSLASLTGMHRPRSPSIRRTALLVFFQAGHLPAYACWLCPRSSVCSRRCTAPPRVQTAASPRAALCRAQVGPKEGNPTRAQLMHLSRLSPLTATASDAG